MQKVVLPKMNLSQSQKIGVEKLSSDKKMVQLLKKMDREAQFIEFERWLIKDGR
jgi:hypothetical protein